MSETLKDKTKRIGVLLFHGLTGMPSELKPLVKYLKQKGFEVQTPLIAGHGSTHQDLLKTTWQDWLESAQEALAEIRQTCDEIYTGGLSMGAVLAIALASRNPDLKGLLLLSPHLGIMQDDLQSTQCLLPLGYHLKPAHGLFYWTEKSPFGLKDERLQRKIEQAIKSSKAGQTSQYGLYRTYIGSIYQMLDLVHFCKKNAHQVHCPTFILQSMEDTITKIENATVIYSLLGSSVKRIRMFTGCNHVMSVDLRKKDVANWIDQFIQEQSGITETGTSSAIDSSKDDFKDFDQLHVDISSGLIAGKRQDTITVRMDEVPILSWPISQNRINSLQKPLGTMHFLLGKSPVLTVDLTNEQVEQDIPHEVRTQAWKRAWTALQALRKAQKISLVLLADHYPASEFSRSFWQINGFAQIPLFDDMASEAPQLIALHHQNPIIQNALLIFSLKIWEQYHSLSNQRNLAKTKNWRRLLGRNLLPATTRLAELTKQSLIKQ